MNKGVRQLAEATGYSVATISRVLNGSDAVKKATRDHVLKVARQLNFFPNPAARALATKRTRVIGAVIPTIENSIFATFVRVLEETLAEKGYSLVIAITGFEVELEKVRAFQLMNMGAEALVVSGLDHDADLLNTAAARKVPILSTSIYKSNATLPTIGYDNYELGRQAMQFLCDLGHKNIAVIHGSTVTNDRTQLRIEGIRSGIKKGTETIFFEAPFSITGGSSATRQLFKAHRSLSAILCVSDVLAMGVLFEAQRLKWNIPGDISVMGFDDLEWACLAQPPLTTIRLPVADMGRCAAEALINNLDNRTELVSKLLDGDLIVRESTSEYLK